MAKSVQDSPWDTSRLLTNSRTQFCSYRKRTQVEVIRSSWSVKVRRKMLSLGNCWTMLRGKPTPVSSSPNQLRGSIRTWRTINLSGLNWTEFRSNGWRRAQCFTSGRKADTASFGYQIRLARAPDSNGGTGGTRTRSLEFRKLLLYPFKLPPQSIYSSTVPTLVPKTVPNPGTLPVQHANLRLLSNC